MLSYLSLRVLLLALHISYDPDHIVPVEFRACVPGVCHTHKFVQFHCINEETEAELVDSLPKVTTDKYPELAGP